MAFFMTVLCVPENATTLSWQLVRLSSTINLENEMRNLPYYLAAVALLVTMSMPAKAQTPDDLENGEQKGVVHCTVNGESLTCVIVEWKGNTYSIAGFVKDGDFYARYVGRQSNGKWVIVWSYGQTI